MSDHLRPHDAAGATACVCLGFSAASAAAIARERAVASHACGEDDEKARRPALRLIEAAERVLGVPDGADKLELVAQGVLDGVSNALFEALLGVAVARERHGAPHSALAQRVAHVGAAALVLCPIEQVRAQGF